MGERGRWSSWEGKREGWSSWEGEREGDEVAGREREGDGVAGRGERGRGGLHLCLSVCLLVAAGAHFLSNDNTFGHNRVLLGDEGH